MFKTDLGKRILEHVAADTINDIREKVRDFENGVDFPEKPDLIDKAAHRLVKRYDGQALKQEPIIYWRAYEEVAKELMNETNLKLDRPNSEYK